MSRPNEKESEHEDINGFPLTENEAWRVLNVLHPTLEQVEGNEGTANFTHCFNIIEHLVTGSMKQTIIK